ncbi:hypothetical protein [Enhygromyxa salina]|uniref:Uncharacterized protein n=1 Tax=Enhygromyxa salina TaxID=215803 RepID=A0A2S9YNS8_9BACT|nr:hypothetical protein [Enhygromyxa salina]PRQ06734.1 hypothetical protein ENSA7_36100 [Enhygromyxa salina]
MPSRCVASSSSGRRSSWPCTRTLAFGLTLLATASVHADEYACRELLSPEADRPEPEILASTGGLWFGVHDSSNDARCQWIAENGDSQVAVIERFQARSDVGAVDDWVWISSDEWLDDWWLWRLECEGLGRICDMHGCEGLPVSGLPVVGLDDDLPSPALEQVYAERWTCGRKLDTVLRVRLSPLPPSCWTRGALRARYPDGRWAVTLAEPGDATGSLAPLPMPAPDEQALTLELVDGGGRVVDRYDIEIDAQLRANPSGIRCREGARAGHGDAVRGPAGRRGADRWHHPRR